MRIAFISQYFYPENYFHNAIAIGLVERGHELHTITCVPNYGQETFFKGYSNSENRSEIWNGIVIDRAWTFARGRTRWRLALNYLIYPFSALWTIYRKMKQKPDVTFIPLPSPIFQSFVGVVLKKLWGVPTVYWVLDIWPESLTYNLNLHSPLVVKPLEWMCGWLYRQADYVMVQNKGFIPTISRFGVPQERIRILTNTANALYRPVSRDEAPDEAQLIPQSGFRLMFAGNIGENQDFDSLIKAAYLLKDHRDITWSILGTGRGLEKAKAQVRDYGLESNVLFLGRYPEERMPYFFAHADAMLVSLKTIPIFEFTVPAKLQSYMACGKPIIASLAGEGACIIEEAGAGITTAPGAPEKLALAILEMRAMSAEQLASYGTNAFNYFQAHFSQEVFYTKLQQSLRGAIEMPKHEM